MNEFIITDLEQLILIRKRKNITQNEVAKYLKVSQVYISNYENNKEIMRDDLKALYKEYITKK